MYVNFLSSSDVPSLHHDIAILTASCCVPLHCNPPVQKMSQFEDYIDICVNAESM